MRNLIVDLDPLTTENFPTYPLPLDFTQEVVANGEDVYVNGILELVSGNPFKLEYYIDSDKIGETLPSSSILVNLVFSGSDLAYGKVNFIIVVKSVIGETIATITKEIWHTYYDFFVELSGDVQPKKDLDIRLNSIMRIFIGMSQPVKQEVAEDIIFPLTITDNSSAHFIPIFDSEWLPRSKQFPQKIESIESTTFSMVAGDQTVSLKSICITSKPFYGIILETVDSCSLELCFDKADFSYYKTYIDRPEVIEFDKVTISWENIVVSNIDRFLKYELYRDNIKIYETSDYTIKSYDDWAKDLAHPNGVELGKVYQYKVAVLLDVPINPEWYTIDSYENLWEKTVLPDDTLLIFKATGVEFQKLPISLDVPLDEITITTPNIIYTVSEGLHVDQTGGSYLHKEHVLLDDVILDFSDRFGLVNVTVSTFEDFSKETFTFDTTYYKDLSKGKFYFYKVKKWLRSLRIYDPT